MTYNLEIFEEFYGLNMLCLLLFMEMCHGWFFIVICGILEVVSGHENSHHKIIIIKKKHRTT
jgi:hypothetical protein